MSCPPAGTLGGASDGLSVRVTRLFSLVRVPVEAETPPFWQPLDDHLRERLRLGTSLNEAEQVLASHLNSAVEDGALSTRQLNAVLQHLGAPTNYFDLAQPRYETETQLLLTQLEHMGISAFRLCRAHVREFDRVAALQLLVDVATGVAPRSREIDSAQ